MTGASGLFLAASQFPKNRETRAPLVIEILGMGGLGHMGIKFAKALGVWLRRKSSRAFCASSTC